MKLWSRIKYRVFTALLNDICRKTKGCAECELGYETVLDCLCLTEPIKGITCREADVFAMARRAWRLEE